MVALWLKTQELVSWPYVNFVWVWELKDITAWNRLPLPTFPSVIRYQAAHNNKAQLKISWQLNSKWNSAESVCSYESGVSAAWSRAEVFISLSLSGFFLRTWLWKSSKDTDRNNLPTPRHSRQQSSFRHPLHKRTNRTASTAVDQVVGPGLLGNWASCGVRDRSPRWLFLRDTAVLLEEHMWVCEHNGSAVGSS